MSIFFVQLILVTLCLQKGNSVSIKISRKPEHACVHSFRGSDCRTLHQYAEKDTECGKFFAQIKKKLNRQDWQLLKRYQMDQHSEMFCAARKKPSFKCCDEFEMQKQKALVFISF